MDDHTRPDENPALSVRLDLHLDRQPISGRLRTEQGADEWFVGWVGFVDALKRLHERERRRQTRPASGRGLGVRNTPETHPHRKEPRP